jgi:hypothetical protein
MKTKLIYGACALALAVTSLTSCNDEQQLLTGEGKVMLSTKVSSDVKVVSRAATESELNEKLIVWISNSKGAVRKYNGYDNIPADGIDLVSGHYIVEGWTGDSISASFDDKYYKGREEFDIENGQTSQVELTCKIANSVVSVNYSDDVQALLSDYTMTVGHARGELTFEGNTTQKGYYMMPSTDKNLQWNLQGKLANGTLYTRSGVIENAKPATEYIINVKISANGGDDEFGGGYFDIEIEENPIVVEDDVYITMAPKIEGYDFDIANTIYSEKGKVGRYSIFTTTAGTISNYKLSNTLLTDIVGGDTVDLIRMSSDVKSKLTAAGINFTTSYDAANDVSWLKLNLEETLLNSLDEGTYDFVSTVTDSNGKTSTGTFKLIVSDAVIITNPVVESDVWARHATVTATILQAEKATSPGINYRKYGSSTWTAASVSVDGNTVTAKLTDLDPETQYEYVAVSGEFTSTQVYKFTTENVNQLPNASFENGFTSSSTEFFYTEGGDMFWDSGNTGSATMSVNVTQRSTDKTHAGTYGLKLQSQFVGVGILGKFAAGNVFVGKYLATVSTNGVLGWGRTWSSRPTKLKGWAHYTPGTVQYTSSDLSSVSKGDIDTGIIYIAILDDTMNTYGDYSFPVIVNTSTKQFFSQNDANVIAYGELVFTGATDGDDMVEFEIPLTYKRTDVKASNIMITCSASRYGDYFVGGASTLYLDDFQLVYE